MMRPSSSAPSGTFVAPAGGRPSTAPTFGALSAAFPDRPEKRVVADDGDEDELIAVRLPVSDGGAALFSDGTPIPEVPHRTYSAGALPEVARAPPPMDSRDRFLDDAVVPCAVPRARGAAVSASAHFEEIHKLFHDLLLAFFYSDSDSGEAADYDGSSNNDDGQGKPRELKEARREARWRERRARRNNPKYAFLLERLLPLVAQGLTELGHATTHRQLSLERVLPQAILLAEGTAASSSPPSPSAKVGIDVPVEPQKSRGRNAGTGSDWSGEAVPSNNTGAGGFNPNYPSARAVELATQGLMPTSFVQPPGGAITWLARFLSRKNPFRSSTEGQGGAGAILQAQSQRQYLAILAQCLREYDNWQRCVAQRNALEHVDLAALWAKTDTNADGTLDVREISKALARLGLGLRGETEQDEENQQEGNAALGDGRQQEEAVAGTRVAGSSTLRLEVGQKVRARFAGKGHFYPAKVSAVSVEEERDEFDGELLATHVTYSLAYLDGDWEDGAKREHMQVIEDPTPKPETEDAKPKEPTPVAAPRDDLALDLAEMETLFMALDVDGSGDVDFDEFVFGITRWFAQRERLAKAIFDRESADNGDGTGEDAAMGSLLQSLARRRMIRSLQAANLDSAKLFAQIDADSDGFVDHDEFITGIHKLAAAIHEPNEHNRVLLILSRNAVRLFGEIDSNGDGLISLDEFQSFVVQFLDRGVEERARAAAARLAEEQKAHIATLSQGAQNSLDDADAMLAAQRLRLDDLHSRDAKTGSVGFGELRAELSRFAVEVNMGSSQKRGSTAARRTLAEARLTLRECSDAITNAERQCGLASSDIVAARSALSVALRQHTLASRMADLRATVGFEQPWDASSDEDEDGDGEHSDPPAETSTLTKAKGMQRRRGSFIQQIGLASADGPVLVVGGSSSPRDARPEAVRPHRKPPPLSVVQTATRSVQQCAHLVDIASDVLASARNTLGQIKNKMVGIRAHRKEEAARQAAAQRRAEENRRAALKMREMRKRAAADMSVQRARMQALQEASDREAARSKERKAQRREKMLEDAKLKVEEERLRMKDAMRRAKLARQQEEEREAAEAAAREAEAAQHALEIIANFQPEQVSKGFAPPRNDHDAPPCNILTHNTSPSMPHTTVPCTTPAQVYIPWAWAGTACELFRLGTHVPTCCGAGVVSRHEEACCRVAD